MQDLVHPLGLSDLTLEFLFVSDVGLAELDLSLDLILLGFFTLLNELSHPRLVGLLDFGVLLDDFLEHFDARLDRLDELTEHISQARGNVSDVGLDVFWVNLIERLLLLGLLKVLDLLHRLSVLECDVGILKHDLALIFVILERLFVTLNDLVDLNEE